MFASRTAWQLTPNRLSIEVEARRRQGLPILDLTESNPTHCGFVFDARGILRALSDARSLAYEPDPRGLLAARLAVADYYAERGVKIDPQQIFLTTSTSEAYSYIFRLLADPGDNVLLPSPSYPLFDFLTRLNDLEMVSYPLVYEDGWHIDLAALRVRLNPRTRAILVVHPNNPTGSFVHPRELKFLLDCCRERGLALVSDEVFADYASEADEAGSRPAATLLGTTDALVFTLSGLSKISALPQMKLAWIAASGPPDELQDALARLEMIADTYLSVTAPLAHALPELLESRHVLQPQIFRRVRSNLSRLDQQLSSGSPVTRLRAEGGWYVILKLPAVRTDEEWAVELLRRDGVLVHPGHFFDFQSEAHLVASLLPGPEVFQPAVEKILACAARSS